MLRTLVSHMRDYPGRKTLLLISGGMIASDRPGGRPDHYDPWWMYWLGDYRIYPAILDTLHELGR